MEKTCRERRRLLKRLALFAGGGLLLWKYLVPSNNGKAKRELLRVNKADLPHQGALVFRESRVAIVHEGEEMYALSLVCSHLGCTVNVTSKDLVCPCHGSVFNRQGEPLKGPAKGPLQRLVLQDQGGTVAVLA
ncbi:MAG: cytochrome B6 [Desulfuromonas sp.]|nr:MAG: cytochrome B6 [Desulfuromonas sp.]